MRRCCNAARKLDFNPWNTSKLQEREKSLPV
jgi:hypothetical protein